MKVMIWDYFSLNWMRISPLLAGWILDRFLGDPEKLPHPIVGFGNLISTGEKYLNKGQYCFVKGAILTFLLVIAIYIAVYYLIINIKAWNIYVAYAVTSIGVFYCLAGQTLSMEVKNVFKALEGGINEGRNQLSRIVGRDTSELNPQQIRTAALETYAENLSDGVVAPMLWFAILGLPGMMAYKMINTMDSMIGYRNERYEEFGKTAARLDDIVNFIPARITAYTMLFVARKKESIKFVRKFGRAHTSPNSGYPEAALAAILNCRFGGTHIYSGQLVEKPWIGVNEREITFEDLVITMRICTNTEILVGTTLTLLIYFI